MFERSAGATARSCASSSPARNVPICESAFAALGVSERVIRRDTARWRRFDLYMNADPWEAVSLRRVDKQLNFFHGVAGKFDLDCPVGLPLGFERYDRVAFPNEGRRDAYVAAGIVPEDRAVLVGYPKADVLTCRPCDSRALAASLGLDADRGRPPSSRRRSPPHPR